ncbi:MAG: anaerobic ribonucleoside-triphosphate reductase activating protein [Deltaproteobacteria bacterium]|nr:anaerobic ribonucleoside-triphosphate reductase activating protein [Deltaproteobacteria bacterium]
MIQRSSSPWNRLRGVEPCSLCDWPGRVSAVLFFGGCNLRCPDCHNRQLAWNPEVCSGPDPQQVRHDLESRAGWLDGIVVSGGEPTLVPGIDTILAWIKSLGLPARLDTNGFAPEIVAELNGLGLVEEFAVDVKGPWERYPELTGGRASALEARRCLEKVFGLAESHPGRFRFRCTRVPGLTEDDIDTVRSLLPSGHDLAVQNFVSRVN